MAIKRYGKNQIIARQENIMLIKSLLYRRGPISRAQMAEELELTPPTITNITAELIDNGILYEIPEENPVRGHKAGRHPIMLDYRKDARFAIGVSLGKTSTHYCVCDLRGNIVDKGKIDKVPDEYEEMVTVVEDLISELKENNPGLWDNLIGIGISVPAVVDAHTGIIGMIDEERTSWIGKPFGATVEEMFGVPVRVENNVRARTLTLRLFQPEVVASVVSFVLCYASWGIAGPMILQERSVRGEDGAAGEIGHIVVDTETGKTLEEYAGMKAILENCRALLKENKAPVLSKLCPDPGELTIEMIHQAQREGDPDVTEVMHKAMRALGITLSNIISFMNPDLIVLGGPMLILEENRKLVEDTMRQYSYSADPARTEVKYVEFDSYGGAIAAAAVCIDKYFIRWN